MVDQAEGTNIAILLLCCMLEAAFVLN